MLQNGYPRDIINYNANDVLNKHKNMPSECTLTVSKKDVILVLPYLGFHSRMLLHADLNLVSISFMVWSNSGLFFRTLALRMKSFFPYKDRFKRSLKSKIVYKASCLDYDAFYIGKTKRRLHDRKTEHFKALTHVGQASAVADHSTSTGHNIKRDHFEILVSGQYDLQCKIKETLNENVGSEKLFLY